MADETQTLTLTDGNAPGSSPGVPGGTITPGGDWRGSLPDDLRSEKALADFKDVGSLAKSYVETKRMVGDAVRVPGKDAKPEEVAAFHRKLGVPETPDKYEVTLPALPEGHPAWQPEMLTGFKGAAHQAGLTPPQVQALIGWYATNSIQTHDVQTAAQGREQVAARATAVAALEKEWGPKDGPTWTRNLALARNAVRRFFGDDPQLAELAEMRGNDPVWVKGLAKLGEQTLEDGYLDGDVPGSTEDPDAIAKQIADLRTEMSSGKVNAGSTRYTEMQGQLNRLSERHYYATQRRR